MIILQFIKMQVVIMRIHNLTEYKLCLVPLIVFSHDNKERYQDGQDGETIKTTGGNDTRSISGEIKYKYAVSWIYRNRL